MLIGKWITMSLLLFVCAMAVADDAPLTTVPHVDLTRYTGRWYEIARYPNRFQKDCTGDTTATYSLKPDGKVRVVNECRTAEGKTKRAEGTAKVTDAATNSKLKVTFFWPFYGKYWILELGENYQYAVIGEPSRKYLWILSREPRMDEAVYQQLIKKIRAHGYDPSRLMKTPQPNR